MVQNSGFYRGIVESSTAAVVVVGAGAAVRYHTPEAGLILATDMPKTGRRDMHESTSLSRRAAR